MAITQLEASLANLRRDLLREEGPQISTMRNYRFALLPYEPQDEFALREKVQRLSNDLSNGGWVVLSISLQKLLLRRLRSEGEGILERIIATEKEMSEDGPEDGLTELKEKVCPIVEGKDGLAKDIADEIGAFVKQHPDKVERTLVLIGRAGALYPFLRVSALLKFLDGNTQNVPVVLLYPGNRSGPTGLSSMGEKSPDRDYRPRIY